MNDSVCIMGMGYVGLTLSVSLCEAGYNVWGIEKDDDIVNSLNSGQPHFYEENLSVRLNQQLTDKKLKIFNVAPKIDYDVIIIAVGTPLVKNTKVPDESFLNAVATDVGKLISKKSLVCVRSTVPVGFTRSTLIEILEKNSGLKAGAEFHIAFTPERTIEGKALTELRENTQIIGGLTEKCIDKASVFYRPLTPTIITVSSLEAAEFIKIVDNTYRDVHFAYSNELALISEKLNLDISEIIQAANIHYPRNNIPVPSPGVGGACLSKDPYILMHLSNKAGYNPKLISEARQINESIPALIVDNIEKKCIKMSININKANVLIIGFAFKGNPETTDIRNSTSITLLREFQRRFSCKIKGYDPIVDEKIISDLDVEPVTIPDGFKGIDIMIIANNHLSYKFWNILDIVSNINKPSLIYDSWRILNKEFFNSQKKIVYMAPGL